MKFIVILVLLPLIYCLNNGLGRTPAMGWNSWNKFGCSINEDLIKQTADALVLTGLKKAGYQYVNLDDCWQVSRDPNTDQIIADPQAFPHGIKALADYVHALGLKFGLYSDAGEKTCQGRPGGLYHETVDANTYAAWGVDYLKYDNCYNDDLDPKFRYPRMRDALNASGRAIFFSLCEWGQENPWEWGADMGNSWRTTGDISDKWESVMDILEKQVPIATAGAPGGWNDPDMLEVGNGGMTTTEYESHFALWAALKAPLIIGCDVRKMSLDTYRILANTEIIAINQDPLGKPATRLSSQGNKDVWGSPIVDGFAAVLLNKGDNTTQITLDFGVFNVTGSFHVRDLSSHQDLGTYQNSFTTSVASHGVAVLKLTPVSEFMDFLGW